MWELTNLLTEMNGASVRCYPCGEGQSRVLVVKEFSTLILKLESLRNHSGRGHSWEGRQKGSDGG